MRDWNRPASRCHADNVSHAAASPRVCVLGPSISFHCNRVRSCDYEPSSFQQQLTSSPLCTGRLVAFDGGSVTSQRRSQSLGYHCLITYWAIIEPQPSRARCQCSFEALPASAQDTSLDYT